MIREKAIHKIEQDYDEFRNEMFSLPSNELYSNAYKISLITELVFGTLLALKHLVANKSLWIAFRTDITALIDAYDEYISLDAIGFTENWEELLFSGI